LSVSQIANILRFKNIFIAFEFVSNYMRQTNGSSSELMAAD